MTFYLIQTQPNREAYAKCFLTDDDFEVYYPRVRLRRSHAGKVDFVIKPLFSRYLFIKDDGVRGPFFFRSAPGVASVVCVGNRPILVGQSVVDQLRQREDADGFVKLDQYATPAKRVLDQGEAARVISGRYRVVFDVIFSRRLANERAEVFVNLLGKASRMIVQYSDLAYV